MKLEVGMYVRTKDGIIAKVDYIDNDTIFFDKELYRTYGEWGALNLEQRKYIKRLLDELDSADNYIKNVYLENQKYKEIIGVSDEKES